MLEQPAFGARLRALRVERGLSQASVAEGIMSTGYLSRLESGARPPTTHVVAQVAERLDVPVSVFDVARGTPASLAALLASITSGEDAEEVADRLVDALRADETADPTLRWQGMWLLARMHDEHARYTEEHDVLVELVALGDEVGATELRARGRVQLAKCLRVLGELARAVDLAGQAHRMAAVLPVHDRANALSTLISTETEAGDLTQARLHCDELRALTEPLGGVAFVEALWASATVLSRQGDRAEAERLLARASASLDGHGNQSLWVRLRLAAASLHLQATPPVVDEAQRVLDEVEPVVRSLGSAVQRQQLLSLRAHLAFEEGRFDDAEDLSGQVDTAQSLLSFRDQLRLEALRGELLISRGEVAAGTRFLQSLGQRAEETGSIELAATIWRALARALAGAQLRG